MATKNTNEAEPANRLPNEKKIGNTVLCQCSINIMPKSQAKSVLHTVKLRMDKR